MPLRYVRCPRCGWEGELYFPYHDLYARCPYCDMEVEFMEVSEELPEEEEKAEEKAVEESEAQPVFPLLRRLLGVESSGAD